MLIDGERLQARGVFKTRHRVGGRDRLVAIGADAECVAEVVLPPGVDIFDAIEGLRQLLDKLDPPAPALEVVEGGAPWRGRRARKSARPALASVGR